MDTNKLLKDHGYGDRSNFGEIAKVAHDLDMYNWGAAEILDQIKIMFPMKELLQMKNPGAPVKFFGDLGTFIDYKAVEQAMTVASLPITKKVAVMPDGHPGYGVPIGGVVLTEPGTVIPGAVGVDIYCSMMLSVLDIPVEDYRKDRQRFVEAVRKVGKFGKGAEFYEPLDHPVMDDHLWHELPICIKEKARHQLGTSGGGNHFLDIVEFTATVGKYAGETTVAILTHSGSRNPGKTLAEYFIDKAKTETRKIAKGIPDDLCWLDLGSDVGKDYWRAMQLMGEYTYANHELIHDRLLKEIGGKVSAARAFNAHNFAEITEEGVLHRKGATPANRGQLGVIPGSSGTTSFFVAGKGNPVGMCSSSHGAGRPFSRSDAKKKHDEELYQMHMAENDIIHIGVAPDETFMAYKDIHRVMELQSDLVDIVAVMQPSIVMMGGKNFDDGD
jgi:tRNA-splicing ligase RtcB (3'-phosphate/5'-hydroxy nucleic acid ligase)